MKRKMIIIFISVLALAALTFSIIMIVNANHKKEDNSGIWDSNNITTKNPATLYINSELADDVGCYYNYVHEHRGGGEFYTDYYAVELISFFEKLNFTVEYEDKKIIIRSGDKYYIIDTENKMIKDPESGLPLIFYGKYYSILDFSVDSVYADTGYIFYIINDFGFEWKEHTDEDNKVLYLEIKPKTE